MRRVLVTVALVASCASEPPTQNEAEDNVTATTIVSLTFDDTFAEQAQAASLLEARGMRGTFFVNSPRIGTTGYLSRAQIDALAVAGHEIGGHTLDHPHLPALTTDQQRHEICDDRTALLAMGYRATSFAYPFGDSTLAVEDVVRQCGYTSARDVGGLATATSCSGCPYASTMPPRDAYNVPTPGSVRVTTTLDEMKSWVTQAEQHGGGWVPLVMHHICDGCDEYSVSAANLGAFLDWLAARAGNGTFVRTVDQVINPPRLAPNLVQNGSLEIDANHDLVPDCWQRGGYGTSTATFTLVGDAADGAVAQRIDVTSFSSGARRLVTKQDQGACAPAATAGAHYTMTGSYHANVPARFTVYTRNSAGAWQYFTESPLLPASTTYRVATFTTPALPAGTAAISFGLSIYQVGSITMDKLALVAD
ncbi:MAG TPA: polysaccharide deacetylase family protein [Kofleriaceae bacterium]|nr:polysaccharide deacetylase family protein [Kofleriaceae bacterium]